MNIVTIDTGTTNTRSSLWIDGQLKAQAHAEVGVRDTAINGSNAALKQAVRDTVNGALSQAGFAEEQVDLMLASGMITSNVGLSEIPHLPAPAGLQELAQGMQSVVMREVFPQPVWFIPGVRNSVDKVGLHNHEAMDMMRGEETEAMALLARLKLQGSAMIILPGSHTKLVSIDNEQRIVGCATSIAGELLQAITQHTLLKKSVEGEFASELHPEMLLAGAAAAQRTGLARACFSVRILDLFTESQLNEKANFLLGAVLSGDLLTLKNSSAIRMRPDTSIIISGKPMLRQALALLIKENGFFYGKQIVVNDEDQDNLAGFGAITIAAARGLVPQAAAQ
ncbi:2-dehydro-3-deoxygalactonokinase [Undibacterium terreum]|uniref:MFS transporter n=1 Tax=Undibacterium terreum TaxID=1224302 RepID=A0A916XMJ6_9BURK|nr:2-dehydro-3-deoxygalactonokinase [Undibacterium terreum]GGC84291.1 MFS transporter [Undibacterium terreum]